MWNTANSTSVFVIWATAVTEMLNATEDPVHSSETNGDPQPNWHLEGVNQSTTVNRTAITVGGPIQWNSSRVGVFVVGLIVMFKTVFGNLLVILSVGLEKKLQTPFNYYIVNLAVTDLNVGLSAMTLFTIYNLYGYFPFSFSVCNYWIWCDYTMTFESVATLAVISIDRLWSVTWSLHYRTHNSGRKSLAIIICTWLYVNAFWQPAYIYDRLYNADGVGECAWTPQQNLQSVVYVGILGYYLPLSIMILAYARIFYVMRRRLKQISHQNVVEPPAVTTVSEAIDASSSPVRTQHSRARAAFRHRQSVELARTRREKRAFFTLGHIVVTFLICWIPFYTYFLINPYHPNFFPDWYGEFSYWMAYLNSALNPVLYGVGNDDFRRSFKKILFCKRCKN